MAEKKTQFYDVICLFSQKYDVMVTSQGASHVPVGSEAGCAVPVARLLILCHVQLTDTSQ